MNKPQSPIGVWNILTMDSGTGPNDRQSIQLEWTAKKISMRAPNGEMKAMGSVMYLDEESVPCELNLEHQGLIGRGIFRISGETMQLQVADPGEPRPAEFQGRPEAILFDLCRG